MGILMFILSWGIVILIWTLQEKSRVRQQEEMRRCHIEFVRQTILESFGKMLAFVSKADGRISREEVEIASQCLRSMGLSESEYQQCVSAFNSVHDSSFEEFRRCAERFAGVTTVEARILLYEMLWIVAAADGVLESGEAELLSKATDPLEIDRTLYHYFHNRYFAEYSRRTTNNDVHDTELEEAYAKLGCAASDSDETLKSAYRRLAMRYHPDRLRAEGLPEGMITQATKSMSEINSAWEIVRRARNIN